MRQSLTLLACITIATALLVTGCSPGDRGFGKSVVEVVAINEGTPVIDAQFSFGQDRLPGGGDDYIPAGHYALTVRNRPYNAFINSPDETPFGQFNIVRVEVVWEEIVTGTAASNLLALTRTYDYNISIPSSETVTFNIMLVPFEIKEMPFLVALRPAAGGGSNAASLIAQARVTMFGFDSGAPGDIYPVVALIPVEFVGLEL